MSQIDITKNPDYSYVTSTGIFGGVDPNGARILFFLDRLEPEMKRDQPGRMQTRKLNRELQVEVHMSPLAYKNMAAWMARNVKKYEDQFGVIIMGPTQEDEEPNQSHIS